MVEHKHLIIRSECNKCPVDPKLGIDFVKRLVPKLDMKIMPNGGPFADYVTTPGNMGMTVVTIIETSHIALNVWDQEGIVQLDVYSCKDYDPGIVFNHLREFEPTKIEFKFLDRKNDLHEIL